MIPQFAAPLDAFDEMQLSDEDGVPTVRASKKVTADDPYMAAHFPGRTIYPGVFILETVRQAVAAALGERAGELADLSAVHSLRFTGASHPGEQLVVVATLRACESPGEVDVEADCRRGDGSAVARLALRFRYPEPTGE